MRFQVSPVLNASRKGFTVIAALAAIGLALAGAQSAPAATPSYVEGLTGTGASTGGSTFGPCPHDYFPTAGSTGFSVSGTATGSYPGSFSEIGSASVLDFGGGGNEFSQTFKATFTITSGTRTITGSFAGTQTSMGSASVACNSAHHMLGFSINEPVTYTTTIDGQTSQGTGTVSGTFLLAAGAKVSVSETLALPHGQISGTVTDSRTSAPIGGICVDAYDSSGGVLASTQSDSSGAYTLSGVLAGSVKVGFATGCGAGNYLTQYYNDQPSLSSSDPISVSADATTSGINAAMVGQAQITGTVTARATRAPLGGICVRAHNSSGRVTASTQTNSNGSYTIGSLPTGTYRVAFADCNHRGYVKQYYKDKTSLASADPIALLTATTRSGVNAAMVKRPQIVAGTPVAARSAYTIRRTSGISWHAELWVLMYCRKGYTALHGGYATPPSGFKIESSGPSRAGGLSMWAIEVRNTTGRWLELHSWATCARG